MDFRESGIVTFPVRIKGVIRDAATGQPVPDVVVTYGGIPVRTGPNGYFALRNVLAPRERPLEVQAAGYLPLTQTLAATAGTNEVQLVLQQGPRPALTVTAGTAAWKNEAAGVGTLELRLENTGAAEATDVRLSAPGFQVAPERIPALPAGKPRPITLFFRRERDAAPEPLRVELQAGYAAPDGLALSQALTVETPAPAWSAPPPAPVTASVQADLPAATKPNTLGAAAATAGSTAAALGAAVGLQRRKQRKGEVAAQQTVAPPPPPTPGGGVTAPIPLGPPPEKSDADRGAAPVR
jgi:hypothetical protein